MIITEINDRGHPVGQLTSVYTEKFGAREDGKDTFFIPPQLPALLGCNETTTNHNAICTLVPSCAGNQFECLHVDKCLWVLNNS